MKQTVRIKRIHPRAIIPAYQTEESAGFDFHLVEDVEIEPGKIAKTRTGLVIEVPKSHALLIPSRSSGPIKLGITMANAVGVIDADYAGEGDEIYLLLYNLTEKKVKLGAGDRVAQGLIVPILRAEFEEVEEMGRENRGGFGSTDK